MLTTLTSHEQLTNIENKYLEHDLRGRKLPRSNNLD